MFILFVLLVDMLVLLDVSFDRLSLRFTESRLSRRGSALQIRRGDESMKSRPLYNHVEFHLPYDLCLYHSVV